METRDVLALAAVAVGLVGYFINAWHVRKDRALAIRTEAYIDFLRGICGCSAYKRGTEPHNAFTAVQMEARARILVYGDKEVADAVSEFWRLGAEFDTLEKQNAFVQIIRATRRSGDKTAISD